MHHWDHGALRPWGHWDHGASDIAVYYDRQEYHIAVEGTLHCTARQVCIALDMKVVWAKDKIMQSFGHKTVISSQSKLHIQSKNFF